jgi:hypothetical protein
VQGDTAQLAERRSALEKKGKLVWYLRKDLDAFMARGRTVTKSIEAMADEMFEATRG